MSEGRPPDGGDPQEGLDPRPDERSAGSAPEPPATPGPVPEVDPESIPDPLETGEWKTEPDPFDTGEWRLRREAEASRRSGKRRRRKRAEGKERSRGEARAAGAEGAGAPPARRTRTRERVGPSDSAPRRRRLVVLIAAIAVVAVIVVLLVRSCDGSGGEEKAGLSDVPLPRLVGQTIVGKVDEGGPRPALLKRIERGEIGGVLIGLGRESEVKSASNKLQRAARRGGNPPLLLMMDQEGGFVKRLPGPPDAGPTEIAAGGARKARDEGRKTGDYLGPLGINVNLAPVVDVGHADTADTIVSRVFSDDAATVGAVGAGFIEGLQGAGVAATAKHFPALGLATENTDFAPVTVDASAREIEADLVPFEDAIDAGVRLVMVSSAVFPAVSGDEQAVYSEKVIEGMLRKDLGFKGAVVTDDLEAPAAGTTPGDAAVRAIRAGADLALLAGTGTASANAFQAVSRAARKGRISRKRLEEAYARVLDLKKAIPG